MTYITDGGPLPRRVRPYAGETLWSYLHRLRTHIKLPHRHLLSMLGHSKGSLGDFPVVDKEFFARLSAITGEPEKLLRDRLTGWRVRSGRGRPMSADQERIVVAGVGCVRCRYLQDGATLAEEFTRFHHVCLRHGVWARSSDGSLPAGSPAPPEAVRAAHRFKRARRHRTNVENVRAYNISHSTFRQLISSSIVMALPELEKAWANRASESSKHNPSVLEICYPEISGLATALLGDRCMTATRGLSGLPQYPKATPLGQQHFSEITSGIFKYPVSSKVLDGKEPMSRHIQSAALTFAASVTLENVPLYLSPVEVHRMIDSLLRNRQQPGDSNR